MSRLTKKIFNSVEGYAVNNVPNESDGIYYVNHNVINKLGKLEDLEEKLGCPLEVVFKALAYGFEDETHTIYRTDLIKGLNGVYSFSLRNGLNTIYKYYYLRDYQKTWWLKGEKDEKES